MRAMKSGCAVLQMPELGVLEIQGADRASWLQGMVTQDVVTLADGDSRYGTVVSQKGKLLADFQIRADGARFLLVLPAERVAAIVEHLDARLIIEDVVMTPPTLTVVTLQGPGAETLLPVAADAIAVRRSHTGGPGFDLLIEAADADSLTGALVHAGAMPWSREALESARIAAAIPRWGAELDETVIPLEAGLTDAIHWGKGCYLGQEVIARMAHRGHTNRELRQLRVSGDQVPAAGAELWPAGQDAKKAVGRVTSAARVDGGVLALGFVRRKHFQAGARLQVVDAERRMEAEVVGVRMRAHVTLVPENDPTVTRNVAQTGLLH